MNITHAKIKKKIKQTTKTPLIQIELSPFDNVKVKLLQTKMLTQKLSLVILEGRNRFIMNLIIRTPPPS